MSSTRVLFASILFLAGCEAVASFDRDKISPMTAPPLANPTRDAAVGRLDASVDGGHDGGDGDAAADDGSIDGEVREDAEVGDAGADVEVDADLSDAEVLDAGDAALDASDAALDAGVDAEVEASVDDDAAVDTGV